MSQLQGLALRQCSAIKDRWEERGQTFEFSTPAVSHTTVLGTLARHDPMNIDSLYLVSTAPSKVS